MSEKKLSIQMQAEKILSEISLGQIQRHLENIPERHHNFIEDYFRERDVEKIGRALLLVVFQNIIEELTEKENGE